ncbi:MAG: hypothetical protein AAB469_00690 [Patescibacteria group bacterium]
MNTRKLIVSAVLIASSMVNPLYAQAGFWDIFNPLGMAKTLAKEKINEILFLENQNYFGLPLIQNDSVLASLPIKTPKTYMPKRFYTVAATAYSSTPDQTDHTPFITAAGTHVREGVIAANFLPLGTIIKMPDLFGDKTFIVEDRMNSRYWLNIDIWFPERELAKEFGIKVVRIEIVS